jgi:hypothetical protein
MCARAFFFSRLASARRFFAVLLQESLFALCRLRAEGDDSFFLQTLQVVLLPLLCILICEIQISCQQVGRNHGREYSIFVEQSRSVTWAAISLTPAVNSEKK